MEILNGFLTCRNSEVKLWYEWVIFITDQVLMLLEVYYYFSGKATNWLLSWAISSVWSSTGMCWILHNTLTPVGILPLRFSWNSCKLLYSLCNWDNVSFSCWFSNWKKECMGPFCNFWRIWDVSLTPKMNSFNWWCLGFLGSNGVIYLMKLDTETLKLHCSLQQLWVWLEKSTAFDRESLSIRTCTLLLHYFINNNFWGGVGLGGSSTFFFTYWYLSLNNGIHNCIFCG